MATPPYVPLDPNGPNGPVQTPPQYSATDIANTRALRDMVVSGLGMQGWSFTQSPATSSIPDYYQWADGVSRAFYAVMTYAGAPHYQPLTMHWVYTTDSGASQVSIGPVVNFSFDVVTGTLHSASNMAGPFTLFIVNRARGVWNWLRSDAHAAATGTAVHGLGTMSLQPADGFSIQNGNCYNSNLYYCGVNEARINGAYRMYPYAPSTLPSGVAWDWNAVGIHFNILPGSVIPNIANLQGGEIKRLWVQGAGAITIGSGGGVTFVWATGHPVWGAIGTLVSLVGLGSTSVVGTTIAV